MARVLVMPTSVTRGSAVDMREPKIALENTETACKIYSKQATSSKALRLVYGEEMEKNLRVPTSCKIYDSKLTKPTDAKQSKNPGHSPTSAMTDRSSKRAKSRLKAPAMAMEHSGKKCKIYSKSRERSSVIEESCAASDKSSSRRSWSKPEVEHAHTSTSCRIYAKPGKQKSQNLFVLDERDLVSPHFRHDAADHRDDAASIRRRSLSNIMKTLRSKKSLMDKPERNIISKPTNTRKSWTHTVVTGDATVKVDHGCSDLVECALSGRPRSESSDMDIVRASFRSRNDPPSLQLATEVTK